MSDTREAPGLEGLPDWALEALSASLNVEEAPAKTVLDYQGDPAWELFVEAAVAAEFLPRQLGRDIPSGPERSASEKALLEFAEPTHSPDGVRWTLTQEARRKVLASALATGEISAAAQRTAKEFSDPVSKALRDCATGRATPQFESADLRSLEALRAAASLLTGVTELHLPPLDSLDREIELRRLLAQFERMVGQPPGAGGTARPDRFFGRSKEIEKLRAYIGVIAADTFLASAVRVAAQASRVLRLKVRTPMNVWGIGGVGKTTLIAKFMLEHARAAASRYPFAYLDFDRTTISARHRSGLLAEMCMQVGAQFPELTESMADLRERVREFARRMAADSDVELISLLMPYALEFRDLVDRHLDQLESAFEWARPFLLVFDTFEVVQYTPADVAGLEDFVRLFSHSGERGPWPRLRLILSGRKEIPEFLGEIEEKDRMQLGPLDPGGSAEMLVALAKDAGKSITEKEAKNLVKAVAKRVGDGSGSGVHPLRLRLIGELFRQSTDRDGPAVVQSLLDELSRPPTPDNPSGRLFVDGILVRRILGHVSDPRVRSLADPGLVVRRITPDVIREVMARGTSKPDGTDKDPGDPEEIEPWVVDRAEADSIFEAFRREVSLVEVDGDSLRHRQDVRQEMLPLIQARRPKRFRALHRLAFDFFRTRAESDATDHASAAEAIYHGLWLGESLPDLNRLWRVGPSFDPRIDPDEFEAGTPANLYVRAKAKDRLKAREVKTLPREIAFEWLVARKNHLLTERQLDDALAGARAAAGDDYAALDQDTDVAAVVARLLFRDGRWREARGLIGRHLGPQAIAELVSWREGSRSDGPQEARAGSLLSLARTWATLAGKSGAPAPELMALMPVGINSTIRDRTVPVEMLAYLMIGLASQMPVQDLRSLVSRVALEVSPDQWSRATRTLRLAILTGVDNVHELLPIYLNSMERPPGDPEIVPTVERILFAVRPPGEVPISELLQARGKSQEASAEVDRLWRRAMPALMEAARERTHMTADFWSLVVFQHFDWINPLGNALTRAIADDKQDVIRRSLEEQGLLQPWPPAQRKSQRRPDGHLIVRWAVDRGRLLHLAAAIPPLASHFPAPPTGDGPESKYPQRAFGIADALVHWHQKILYKIGPPPSVGVRA